MTFAQYVDRDRPVTLTLPHIAPLEEAQLLNIAGGKRRKPSSHSALFDEELQEAAGKPLTSLQDDRVKDGNTLSELDCSVNTQVVLQGQLCSVFAVVSKPTAVIKVIKTSQTSDL